jgi:hypothetical protein
MPHAEIATKQALHTLNQLHAELAGKLQANTEEQARLEESMRHVEAVIKLLEPGFSLRKIAIRRRAKNQWFKRGTMFRHALDVLRAAEKPLTSREVAERMLVGVAADVDGKSAATLTGSVHAALKGHDGIAVKRHGDGEPAKWIVA